MSSNEIYAVYATHVDRSVLLGYATGTPKDIHAYFEEKKGYGLEIQTIKPINIPAGYSQKKAALIKIRDRLERELADIIKQIEVKDG